MSQPDLPEEFALLRARLAEVADPRHSRGKVHPLASVLSLAVLALMGGARSMSDISRFGKLRPEVLEILGLRRSPSVATPGRLLRMVSVECVRQPGAPSLIIGNGILLTFDDRVTWMDLHQSVLGETRPYALHFRKPKRLTVPCLAPFAHLLIESEQEPIPHYRKHFHFTDTFC